VRWLQGHRKDVRAVAYAPTGEIVSGGSDKTVRVWAPVSGECVRTIKAPQVVYAVAVSPDGQKIAFAGRPAAHQEEANSVYLEGLGPQEERQERAWRMEGARSIWSLSFSADGQYLAAASRKLANANILDGAGGHWWKWQDQWWGEDLADPSAYAVAFGPQGQLAVTGERVVRVLQGPEGPEVRRYELQCDWAAAVVFDPSGAQLVIAANSFLHFADLGGAQSPRRLKTGIRTVTGLAVSSDGRWLLAAGRPGTVERYDLTTRSLQQAYDFATGSVHGIAFSPDGCTFAIASDKGLLLADLD
jgi:WD40 repeat protein